jgi:hypothetical protein
MYSNENILMKLYRRRSTTTSDIGESLHNYDLEWDKSDFTRHLSESDGLSSYDIDEMAEIFRHRFLEFDMSSISDIYFPTSNEDLNEIQRKKHRSFSDLNFLKQQKQSFLLSKHLSLMDIKSIQWIFLKPREIILKKQNSICSIPQSMKIKPEGQSFNTITINNSLRLSKFSMIRLYITKITEKFSSFVSQTFQPTKPTLITQEIIETYDIIE